MDRVSPSPDAPVERALNALPSSNVAVPSPNIMPLPGNLLKSKPPPE
jgi:hypothetical protein